MFFVDGIHKLNCKGLEIAASVPCELPKTMFSASIKKNQKQTKHEAETMSSIEGSKNSGVVPCKTCGQKAGGNRLNNTPMFTIQPYSAFTGEHHKKTNSRI